MFKFGIYLGLVLVLIASSYAKANGQLQIIAVPGIEIYIDNELKGVTNAQDNGLLIGNLAYCTHTLKAVAKNMDPQTTQININQEFANTITLGEIVPVIQVRQCEQKQLTDFFHKYGYLIIETFPNEVQIEIPTLKWMKKTGITSTDGKLIKTAHSIVLENVPVGKHMVLCHSGGKTMQSEINITENWGLKLSIDFVKGKTTISGSTSTRLPDSSYGYDDLPEEISKEIIKYQDLKLRAENLKESLEELSGRFEPNDPIIRSTTSELDRALSSIKKQTPATLEAVRKIFDILDRQTAEEKQKYAEIIKQYPPQSNPAQSVLERIDEIKAMHEFIKDIETDAKK